jgi:RNA ligase
MNYNFPIIRTIDDVLPHISGRNEFIVAERDYGKIINYVVAMQDTFNMTGPDDLGGAMRREARGLIFDLDGNLMSRPFHKFFNVGEREETQSHAIDLSVSHTIMEKMDGSMIRPLLVDGYLRLGTKMGVTTVGMQAEEFLVTQSYEKKEWLINCVKNSVTPLFEWISPDNQIVLDYNESELVYLGTRDNVTGAYVMDKSCPFPTVPQYGSLELGLNDYMDIARKQENREGDIIRFADGHRVKIKNDWYVRIHKCMDRIRFDRNIVDLIINEEVDDIVPLLPEKEIAKVRDFETRFWEALIRTEDRLVIYRDGCGIVYKNDRKRIALDFVPTLERKEDAQFIFRMLDGSNIRDLLLDYVRKSISTNVKWDNTAEWLGMNMNTLNGSLKFGN